MRQLAVASIAALAVLAGCSDPPSGPTRPESPAIGPDPALGRIAFEQSCSMCHASRDGFDLAMFGFTDATIIRPAVKHVDTATARNIVAYIRTVSAPREPEKLRLFQPGGTPLAGDPQFAQALVGGAPRPPAPPHLPPAAPRWIAPRPGATPPGLPIWSDEATNLDWMPDGPLPAAILD